MITGSILRIYSDKFCQNLHETVTVSGSELHADTSTLSPGKAYWATVEVTDSVVGTSPESNPYKFFSLPNIVLSGEAVVNANGFVRPTTITTDIVGIVDYGLEYTTDEQWQQSRPTRVSGNTVTNLQQNTVYYYRPWVKDEFGRIYVNVDDVDFIRTDYSLPLVKITETYTPTDTTFSGKVAVDSTTTVTAVWAETTAGGTTITTNLVAGTGEQDFTVTGLQPFTKYHLVCKATNQAGTGVSQTIYFTTAQQQEQPVEASVQILKWGIDKSNNDTKCNEMVEYKEGLSLVSNKVYLYDNSEHSGEPLFTYDGEDNDAFTAYFTGLDADTTYFIFGSAVIDGGGEQETFWSEPVEIHTYSLIDIGTITTTNTTASFTFTVDGYSSDTQIEYSQNGESWRRVVIGDQQGDSVTITGLTMNTSYYLRARVANSYKEYCDYVRKTFTTTTTTIEITGFTEDGEGGVDVAISITQQ